MTYIIIWRQRNIIYKLENIVDNYLKDGIFFLKESSGGDNLGEDNTMEILFEYLKKDVPVELAIYTRKYVTEASRKMIPFND